MVRILLPLICNQFFIHSTIVIYDSRVVICDSIYCLSTVATDIRGLVGFYFSKLVLLFFFLCTLCWFTF